MDSISLALTALATGKPIVVIDSENRENEGDLVAAAEFATPELINFMITEGRGLVCAPMLMGRARELELPPMVASEENREPLRCTFTVSVDAASGITTGISAADRARTLRILADAATVPSDLVRPGHIFPLIARTGGVLRREGHTEATTDLLTMAHLTPVGIICEILESDGTMMRGRTLEQFSKRHRLPLLTIDQLIAHRRNIAPKQTIADFTITARKNARKR